MIFTALPFVIMVMVNVICFSSIKLIFGLNIIFFFANSIANAELYSRDKLRAQNRIITSMPIWCSFFRLWTDECVQVDAVTRCGRDAGVLEAGLGQSRRKTQASWRQDTGALEAGRGCSGGRTWAEQTQDAGVLEAGRRHLGGRTRASWRQDAGSVDTRRGQNQTAEYDSFRRDLGGARQNLRCASVQT